MLCIPVPFLTRQSVHHTAGWREAKMQNCRQGWKCDRPGRRRGGVAGEARWSELEGMWWMKDTTRIITRVRSSESCRSPLLCLRLLAPTHVCHDTISQVAVDVC
jgi:hypothetical protein